MMNEPKPKKLEISGLSQHDYWQNEYNYQLSPDHPHRQFIITLLKTLEPWSGLLEVGCNIGQNLEVIQKFYPDTPLAGVDINARAIKIAQQRLPRVIFKVAEARWISIATKFDITLCDAVLMYIDPTTIDEVLKEILSMTQKALIILDWTSDKWQPGQPVKIKYSYARDYERIFKSRGLKVEKIKITKDIWDNPNWIEHGMCYIVHLA